MTSTFVLIGNRDEIHSIDRFTNSMFAGELHHCILLSEALM
jgi:hypothetical protein